MSTVVINLRRSREEMDIKQYEIANYFKVHSSTISGWETDKDPIPLRRLIKYANHYNLSLDYLFGLVPKNVEYYPIELNLEKFSQNLRKLRRRNGMTQKEVAKRLNTSQAAYSHYETSLYLIPTSFLANLTKIYDSFSIDELFGRVLK